MAKQAVKFEINLTYRCNHKCDWCNRLVDTLPIPDSDVSLEQLDAFCQRVRKDKIEISRFKVAGGEPLVHPHFLEALGMLSGLYRDGLVQWFWVLTNTMAPTYPTLPPGMSWRRSPPSSKNHDPLLISPKDLGFDAKFGFGERCLIQTLCGCAFEAWGYAPCALAGAYAHLLRINVWSPDPVWAGTRELCEHCIWTLPRAPRFRLWDLGREGSLPFPSGTLKQALADAQRDLVRFPRYQPSSRGMRRKCQEP